MASTGERITVWRCPECGSRSAKSQWCISWDHSTPGKRIVREPADYVPAAALDEGMDALGWILAPAADPVGGSYREYQAAMARAREVYNRYRGGTDG